MTDVAEKQHIRPLQAGDEVLNSPVGPGVITDYTHGSFPAVNGTLVAVLLRDDGVWFNWTGVPLEDIIEQWREVEERASVAK